MQKSLQAQSDEDFLARLEKLSQSVWEKELFNSPFILDLIEGTLPRKKFANYLIQDYHYLGRFAQAMAMATAKANDLFTVKVFGMHLKITLEFEFPRVWKMMTRFGIRKSIIESSPPLPLTQAYTKFLFDTCENCSSAEAVAAIYPCNFRLQVAWEENSSFVKKVLQPSRELYFVQPVSKKSLPRVNGKHSQSSLARGSKCVQRKREKDPGKVL